MQKATLKPADPDSNKSTNTDTIADVELVQLFDDKVLEIVATRNVSKREAKALISNRMGAQFNANADNLKFKSGVKKMHEKTRLKLQAAIAAATDECASALPQQATGILCVCAYILFIYSIPF